MTKKMFLVTFFSLGLLIFALNPALAATYSYVNSWQVDQGPFWTSVPQAYTGQEAAAYLFGGLPSDYAISTVDSNPLNIDFQAWVSTWGGACGGAYPCGTIVAENYKVSTGGLYSTTGDTSAYVMDWAQGPQYTNYAFKVVGVPEPSFIFLLGTGIAGVGLSISRRKK
jgi:hypothetical protein